MIRKSLAVAAAAIAAALALGAPTPAEAAEPACVDGSRDIKPSGAIEVETVATDGSRGRAQITLRRIPAEDCYWGLLEGPGEIWLERVSFFDDDYKNPDLYLHRKDNEENDVTHTKATVTTEHKVRACGRAYDGERSEGFSIDLGTDGKKPQIGFGAEWANTYAFADGTVCTQWARADTIIKNY